MDSYSKLPGLHFNNPAERLTGRGKSVSRQRLVNRLNSIDFSGETILVALRHRSYGDTAFVAAVPLPCRGDRLACRWSASPPGAPELWEIRSLLVPDGRNLLLVEPTAVMPEPEGFLAILPETCRETGDRRWERHLCRGIVAEVRQNGTLLGGILRDFSAVAFRIDMAPGDQGWLDPEAPCHVSLLHGDTAVFGGECRLIRRCSGDSPHLVFTTGSGRIRRFPPRKQRALRQQVAPAPLAIFHHPFTGRLHTLPMVDLSAGGFSLMEREEAAVLFPGLVIPRLEIATADGSRFPSRVQTIHRHDDSGSSVCGVSILDMDPADHLRLMGLLHRADDGRSHLSPVVDPDALWEFFFQTGFIYPEKYRFLRNNREEIRRSFLRLYDPASRISRHFIRSDGGRILGHLSMLHCHPCAWLIHHHAADRASDQAGRSVLRQVTRYVNDVHRFPSAGMRYVYCYFRGDNRFPSRVFGGFARQLADPRGCSLDTFAYSHVSPDAAVGATLPAGWSLATALPGDIEEAQRFYRHRSGGLLFDAFDLHRVDAPDPLAEEFLRMGLRKERRILALRDSGQLRAILIAEVTDTGLNLSDLTAAVTVLLLDEDLPGEALSAALGEIAPLYSGQGAPVLLYPAETARKGPLACEKEYSLWILNMEALDPFIEFCELLFHPSRSKRKDEDYGSDHDPA